MIKKPDLLKLLGRKGLKVSKRKLQFVEKEVKYLGHIIGKGYKKLSPDRIQGILSIPPPKTKRDVRRLLGLTGYSKLWIDGYTNSVNIKIKTQIIRRRTSKLDPRR